MNAAAFWAALGGRKNGNGILYAALITGMAFPLEASFEAYATALGVVLLGTSAAVAVEDAKRPAASGGSGGSAG